MTGIRGTDGNTVRPPHKPYAWKGEPEPPEVTAMRERYRAREAERELAAGECGCGPDDMCTSCTPADEFAVAFTAALAAQIREAEAEAAAQPGGAA
jgi:hypothetical protein